MQNPLNHPFKPALWLRNRHLQSCFHVLFPLSTDHSVTWEQLDLPDGDFVDLCWFGNANGPLAILLHGIEGSFRSHYIQYMLDALHQAGWQVVVFHFRSCSGRMNRMPHTYHGGFTQDFDYLLSVLQQRFPTRAMTAIGFSLGGSILINHLVQYPQSPLAAAVSVSTPFDLARCVDEITPLYRRPILKSLKTKYLAKVQMGQPIGVSADAIKAIEDFREFDTVLTAPLYGFASADAYYQSASVKPKLTMVQRPCLLLHAADDPMVPSDCIPHPSEVASCVMLDVHRFGGHVGFVDHRLPWRVERWFARRILDFLGKSV